MPRCRDLFDPNQDCNVFTTQNKIYYRIQVKVLSSWPGRLKHDIKGIYGTPLASQGNNQQRAMNTIYYRLQDQVLSGWLEHLLLNIKVVYETPLASQRNKYCLVGWYRPCLNLYPVLFLLYWWEHMALFDFLLFIHNLYLVFRLDKFSIK